MRRKKVSGEHRQVKCPCGVTFTYWYTSGMMREICSMCRSARKRVRGSEYQAEQTKKRRQSRPALAKCAECSSIFKPASKIHVRCSDPCRETYRARLKAMKTEIKTDPFEKPKVDMSKVERALARMTGRGHGSPETEEMHSLGMGPKAANKLIDMMIRMPEAV